MIAQGAAKRSKAQPCKGGTHRLVRAALAGLRKRGSEGNQLSYASHPPHPAAYHRSWPLSPMTDRGEKSPRCVRPDQCDPMKSPTGSVRSALREPDFAARMLAAQFAKCAFADLALRKDQYERLLGQLESRYAGVRHSSS
jgi:hypothetical protein